MAGTNLSEFSPPSSRPGVSEGSVAISPSVLASSSSPAANGISLSGGWNGLDYKESCSTTCFPADPDLAMGNGYVFEVTNTEYRVWTTNGTLLLNATLSSLFGTGSDTLAAPQVRYDPATLRWFVSVEDVHADQIYFAGSLTSDPTEPAKYWNVQHVNPGSGYVPTQPVLAVNEFNLVLTTNLYLGGVFEGAQLWVANKTQILAGAGVATAFSIPNTSNQSLVPAQPVGSSAVMYLVSDFGGSHFDLFTLSGSPPGTTVLSGPIAFPSVTAAPPNATQLGTPNLINVEDARVQSAVWNAGELWAAANVACKPSSDTVARSCLHLWELSTKTDTMLQNFNWSTGAGTYDFFPAVSVTTGDNLVMVFEQSSASLYPGVYATAQSTSDPAGTLELPQTLEAGKGPDNYTGVCVLGTCSFGNYSGAAATPYATSGFWVVGEYIGTDWATDAWHTWIESVTVRNTYRASFSESNLPPGTSWSVVVNGVTNSSTGSLITFGELNGSYSFAIESPISGGPATRYMANLTAGSFTIAGSGFAQSVSYVTQFELSTSVIPADSGSVYPSGGWFNASADVNLSAVASAGHGFANWTGVGPGSYSGTSDPAAIVMDDPISEQAQFFTKVTFLVTFNETGLPTGTAWSIVLNGVSNGSTGSTITFSEPNGSYSFSVAGPIVGGPGTRYVANLSSGAFEIDGNVFNQSVRYVTQYELTTSTIPAGAGTLSPSGGWFNESAVVDLSALAAAGYSFASWSGVGSGSYSGSSNPASLSLNGPISEQAQFSTSVTFGVTFTESGLPTGSAWSVALNGVTNSSTSTLIMFNEPNGSYSFSTTGLVPGGLGIRYAATPVSGSFDIDGAGVSQPISYIAEFQLATSVSPAGAGTVGAASGWYVTGTVVQLTALAGPGYQFTSWRGSGAGNYTGTRDPENIALAGPITEVANFAPAPQSSTSTSSGSVPLWAFLLALAFLLVTVIILGLALRRRARPPPPLRPAVVPAAVVSSPPVAPAKEEWRED